MIKQFSAGDITVRPFNTFKNWTLQSIDSSSVDDHGYSTYYNDKIDIDVGIKMDTPFFPSSSKYFDSGSEYVNSSGRYARTVYNMTDAMFYRYTNEPIKQFGVEYYTQNPDTGKQEVRNIHDRIVTGRIKHNAWGETIVPNSVKIVDNSSIHNTLVMHDDGYTNLYASGAQFPTYEILQACKKWKATPYWVTSSGYFYVTFNDQTTQVVNLTNARQYMALGLPVTYVEPNNGSWAWDTSTQKDYFEARNEHFGESVSSWGPYVAVGSSMDENSLATSSIGYAALFKLDPSTNAHRIIRKFSFPFTQSLDGTLFDDSFGTSVAVNNESLAVGSPYGSACSSSVYNGYVCVYDKDKGGTDNWGIVNMLKGGTDQEAFGKSVAIDNDILAVGAPQYSGSRGAVYIFRKKKYMDYQNLCSSIETGSYWPYVSTVTDFCKELTTSSFVATQSYTPTFVSGNVAWVHEATISSSVFTLGDKFGWSVSLDNNLLLVGTNKVGKGYATLFTCSYYSASAGACPTASWSQTQKFIADSSDGDLNIDSPEYAIDVTDTIVTDKFGYSVSISGKNLVIGCLADRAFIPYYGYSGDSLILGSAYFYQYGYIEECLAYQYWLKTKTFGNRTVQTNNNFGRAVSIDGYTAAVSSLPNVLGHDVQYVGGQYILENYNYQSTGSSDSVLGRVNIYRFDESNDTWYLAGEMRRNKETAKPYNLYGYSLSIGTDYMAVGAPIVNTFSLGCKNYTVESVSGSGYILMEVSWNDCSGNPQTYVYSELISNGATPFTYSFCAQTGSVYLGTGKNLKAVDWCDPMLDENNQTASMASSYSGSVFVYDMSQYEENPYVGNVFYKNGYIVVTHTGSNYENVMTKTGSLGFELNYQGAHSIFEHEYLISVRPGEFNYSTNPTSLNQASLVFDVNQDGIVDQKDVDLVMRYLQYKKFYSEANIKDAGIILEQDNNIDDSWWANDILQTEAEDVLLQESPIAASVNSASFGAYTVSAFQYIEKYLVSTSLLDINGDGIIDLNDGYIFQLYVTGPFNPTNLKPYITKNSTRIYVKDIEDYLNPMCGHDPFKVTKHFLDYTYSSSYDPTGSFLSPYITTVGLYQGNELVAVGKLGRPIKNLIDWPINIVVRFDT